MSDMHRSPRTAAPADSRAHGWRRDYSLCDCQRHDDHCPHCGAPASDSTHCGRCHARAGA